MAQQHPEDSQPETSQTAASAPVQADRKPSRRKAPAFRITRARRELAAQVLERLSRKFPSPETELQYSNPWQLIVAVALSAQCTDVRVNKTTPALFERFPKPADLAASHFDEVFPYIKSISYPNNKTKHLLGLAKKLVEEFGGDVPRTREELQSLPGVGRKTANVVASVLYNDPYIAVDTHVFRVSNRIGLTRATNPRQSEEQLTRLLPEGELPRAHHWLILHGRYTCKAQKPDCPNCVLQDLCRYYRDQQKKAARTTKRDHKREQ